MNYKTLIEIFVFGKSLTNTVSRCIIGGKKSGINICYKSLKYSFLYFNTGLKQGTGLKDLHLHDQRRRAARLHSQRRAVPRWDEVCAALQTWLGEESASAHLNKLLSVAHRVPFFMRRCVAAARSESRQQMAMLLSRLAGWCLAAHWQQSLLNWFTCPGKTCRRPSANVSSEKQLICLLFLPSMDTYILKSIIPQGTLQKEVAWRANWRPYSFPIYSCTVKYDGHDFSLQWITLTQRK